MGEVGFLSVLLFSVIGFLDLAFSLTLAKELRSN